MAGIGIRYAEFARRLPRPGLVVAVVTPGNPADARAVPGLPDDVRRFVRGDLRRLLADCDAVIAQGQLANDLVREAPDLPVAIDLYDPWLIENLHYAPDLGLGPYLNDHASWILQLSRGDFFNDLGSRTRTLPVSGARSPTRAVTPMDILALPLIGKSSTACRGAQISDCGGT
jgi:hypothetical protein